MQTLKEMLVNRVHPSTRFIYTSFILGFFILASLGATTLVAQPIHHYIISDFQIVGSEQYSRTEIEATDAQLS